MNHPEQQLLWDYADGKLDPTYHVMVEIFLNLNPDWNEKLNDYQSSQTGFEEVEKSIDAPTPDVFANLKSLIQEDLVEEPANETPKEPKALTQEVETILEHEWGSIKDWQWSKLLGMDGSFHHIRYDELLGTHMFCLKLQPGAHFPMHKHFGREDTLVIKGSYRSQGQLVQAGDWETKMPEDSHELEIVEQEECWALVRVESDKLVDFMGWAKWRTPFFKLFENKVKRN